MSMHSEDRCHNCPWLCDCMWPHCDLDIWPSDLKI